MDKIAAGQAAMEYIAATVLIMEILNTGYIVVMRPQAAAQLL